MSVSVKEVVTRQDMDLFVRFPHSLYHKNPFWVPAMIKDELHTLNPHLNPAFDNCRAKLWLAFRDGEVVGRIAGIMNHKHQQKWRRTYARFGWIDFIDDYEVSGSLLKAVEAWALKHTMKAVYGPLGFTDFDPEGLLVEGYDKPGLMSTIYNYPYYIDHLLRHSYQKDLSWVEFEVLIPRTVPERISKISAYVKKRHGLEILQVSQTSDILLYIDDIFRLINSAYRHMQGVLKLSERDVNFYLDQMFSFIDPDFVSIVVDRSNRVVAFAITMPTLTDALKKSGGKWFPFGWYHFYKAFKRSSSADLYLMAIHPDLKAKGVSALLLADLITKFSKHRITKAFTHPIFEKNESMVNFWKRFDPAQFRRRCCFMKSLN